MSAKTYWKSFFKFVGGRILFLLPITMLPIMMLTIQPCAAQQPKAETSDPLPSWNEGPAKSAIIQFVQSVVEPGSAKYVDVSQRIAVFDNDGTLWSEAPLPPQAQFAIDEVKRLLPDHPDWHDDEDIKALLAGDVAALKADHYRGLLGLIAKSHAGMTDAQFRQAVGKWLEKAKHPRFNLSYTQVVYQPMLELLQYLRANQFKIWIVSGGGQDFMRVFAEETYGIPPEQIIGSHARMRYELVDGKPTLIKTMDHLFVDDKEGKPSAIAQFIGRRPIACFGNSDGDQAMLEYTTIDNPLPSLGVIVRHTDGEREYEYDIKPPSSGHLETALTAAKQYGWTVVDMKSEWKQIFPSDAERENAMLDAIVGEWLVEDIERRGVVDRAQTTLRIEKDQTFSGSTSVNRYSGKLTHEEDQLQFGAIAMTRRAGPPALMDQESRFTAALEKVRRAELTPQGLLHFYDGDGNRLLVLSKMGE